MHGLAFTLALLAAQALPGTAGDWQPLGSAAGSEVYWDRSGVERSGGVTIARVRRVLSLTGEGSAYFVSRIEIRCAENMGHVIETVSYRGDGTITRTDANPAPLIAIPAGSMFETLRNQVC